ncbi:MAG: hypothetical protein ACM31L_00345 [Actinomycetota bacterium]
MNRTGVAVATDSALTVENSGKTITYNGVHKLFRLHAHHNIAILVYGSPTFMEIPWEIIIRTYRDYHGIRESLSTASTYANEFFSFLATFCRKHCKALVEEHYRNYVLSIVEQIMGELYTSLRTERVSQVEKIIEDKATADNSFSQLLNRALSKLLRTRINALKKLRFSEGFSKDTEALLLKQFDAENQQIVRTKLTETAVDANNANHFSELVILSITRGNGDNIAASNCELDTEISSGIVFVGYGKDDIFPSAWGYDVTGFMLGNVIRHIAHEESITTSHRAALRAFGEDEMVRTFMHGIADEFKEEFGRRVEERAKAEQTRPLFERSAYDQIAEDIEASAECRKLSAIADMPRSLLAELAENMVVLSSIKNRLHDHDTSVGGPISVAVITKGDGLVWIKRDNYFDPSLNLHFLDRNAPTHILTSKTPTGIQGGRHG